MSNQKVRRAAQVVALVFALAIGQVISGGAVQPAYAGDDCGGPVAPTMGNNGWGNGGEDGTNPGSDNGGGVSQGGLGAGSPQSETKKADAAR